MHLIILSANKPPFSEIPIFNLSVMGNTLLDLQLVVARECEIDSLDVVVGFKHEQWKNSDVVKHVNYDWETTDSCASLNEVLAKEIPDDDLLIAYGDTIFTPGIIKQVLRSKYDFTICAITETDDSFREYCVIENGELIRIDKNSNDAFCVFTGIFLIKKKKISLIRQLAQDHLSLGELINIIIKKGEEVHTHIVDQGWHEVNTRRALDNLNANHEFIHELMATYNDWSKRAVKYNQLDWVNRDILIKGMLDVVDGYLPERALDVGTGTGKIMKAIRDKYPDCECWGIDRSDEMLSLIEDKDRYILKNVNADNLSGINNDYYDLVTARMVFHHIENSEKVMSEIKRVLKPGGIFIVCEGNPPSVRAIDWYTQMFSYKEERRTLTEIDLINMLIEAGLNDITTKTIIMKDCSLGDWLNNSGIPSENIEAIKKLHYEAPEYIKEDYNMKFSNNDCFMDWKFSVVYGYHTN